MCVIVGKVNALNYIVIVFQEVNYVIRIVSALNALIMRVAYF